MNEARLRECQVALRSGALQGHAVRMEYYIACGTPSCVLGHHGWYYYANPAYWVPFVSNMQRFEMVDYPRVSEYFGVSELEAGELFGVFGCGGARGAQEAIDYIERFIERKRLEEAERGWAAESVEIREAA